MIARGSDVTDTQGAAPLGIGKPKQPESGHRIVANAITRFAAPKTQMRSSRAAAETRAPAACDGCSLAWKPVATGQSHSAVLVAWRAFATRTRSACWD
jgi:hypothetical protein